MIFTLWFLHIHDQGFNQALFAATIFHLRLSLSTIILNQQKRINKEKKLGSEWKSINLGYRSGRTRYVWV